LEVVVDQEVTEVAVVELEVIENPQEPQLVIQQAL
jgi:hypothetical protein